MNFFDFSNQGGKEEIEFFKTLAAETAEFLSDEIKTMWENNDERWVGFLNRRAGKNAEHGKNCYMALLATIYNYPALFPAPIIAERESKTLTRTANAILGELCADCEAGCALTFCDISVILRFCDTVIPDAKMAFLGSGHAFVILFATWDYLYERIEEEPFLKILSIYESGKA